MKDLKHLKRTWQIDVLGHDALEDPKCSVLRRVRKGFEAFEKDWANRPPEP